MNLIPIRPHVPEGLTIIFNAPQRRGKTLAGVLWALDSFQKGRTVFSNIQLGFPHVPLQFHEIKLQDGASPYWNGHIFIDEFNFYFDCRRSMKEVNIQHGAFLLQQKKQGCNLTGTTHSMDSLDLRLRDNYDYEIVPTVYPAYPEPPQILVMEVFNGPMQAEFYRKMTIDCRVFLGLYDSFAVYNPFKPVPKEPKASRPEVKL
jgi:hypothetical protein